MLATALATLAFAGKERTMSESAKAGKLKTLNKRNTKPRMGLSRFTTVPPALSFKALPQTIFEVWPHFYAFMRRTNTYKKGTIFEVSSRTQRANNGYVR